MQDCSNSIANALVLLQSCTKPSYLGLIKLMAADALAPCIARTSADMILPV